MLLLKRKTNNWTQARSSKAHTMENGEPKNVSIYPSWLIYMAQHAEVIPSLLYLPSRSNRKKKMAIGTGTKPRTEYINQYNQ
jgi:hypothetical protein